MEPRIEKINSKKLIGMSVDMSLTTNKTAQLFRSFMPRRKEVLHADKTEVFDLRVYTRDYHSNFDPSKEFTKWALVEVSEVENVPGEMEVFDLEGGTYAVFDHKGSYADTSIFQYIFLSWLPASVYALDHRPHFEILPVGSAPNDPNAEQQIWVPVRPKKM